MMSAGKNDQFVVASFLVMYWGVLFILCQNWFILIVFLMNKLDLLAFMVLLVSN